MSGGLGKIHRNSCSLASFSSPDPGSVMAANCLPFRFACSQKYAKCERVSVVSPDLDATMKSELWILIFDRTPRIVAGAVVARACIFGWPFTAPNVLRRTSGHKLG